MTIKSLYKDYFQKSRVFLYPVLEIKRGSSVMPIKTFVSWEGHYKPEDRKLICLYYLRDDEEFIRFEKQKLINNPLFHDFKHAEEDKGVYVFDLSGSADDYDAFLKGRYSKMSPVHKKKVKSYYGVYNSNFVYIDSYLNPEKYFLMYSEILGVDSEELKKVGELCDPPDMEKELLTMDIIELNIKTQTT